MSFTKGQWRYQYNSEGYAIYSDKDGRSSQDLAVVYEVTEFLTDEEQGEANARLIVAAPAMLEACRKLIEWDDSNDDAQLISEACSMARLAIRQAEGKQP